MKKDYYFPHEIRTRNDEAVMELIECEGAGGYGIYWALMEYLRTQEGYVGKMVAVKTIARQMRTKPYKVESVLQNYGLFVVEGKTFRSVKLEFVMKPLDNKCKAVEARNKRNAAAVQEQCSGSAEAVSEQNLCNSLETSSESSENASLIKKNKEEENKEEYTSSPISSSSAEAAEEKKPVQYTPAWEQYVDSLQQEEQWKELMAMRTGLKKDFYKFFPCIVENFKRHVRLLGNEGRILSPSDAKHYFCFYLDPGSVTFKKLWEELHKPVDKGKYKFEDRAPTTGQRSYCGIPLPSDAPPRPNNQAVWDGKKWRF